MPVVNGLFSSSQRRHGRVVAEVTTQPHSVQTTQVQRAAWFGSILLAGAALVIVSAPGVRRISAARLRRVGHRAVRRVGLADAFVGLTLLAWWLVSPSYWDDGWIARSQQLYGSTGGFSSYYNSYGVNHVFGFWLDWLQHWLGANANSLIVLRLPALLCLGATWVVCRWSLHRATADTGHSAAAVWAMACAYAAGALAWGMTLRPEPQLALLILSVVACALSFVRRPSAPPVAAAAVLVALAVAAHPVGVLAIAPLIATAPQLIRWAFASRLASATIVIGTGAILTTLMIVGTDLQQRRADVRTLQSASVTHDVWYDELARYLYLRDPQYGTPLRRASVALMLLAALGYLLRTRRVRGALHNLPAATLVTCLALLFVSPTKWPWHFGALIGVAALAAATETARIRNEEAHVSWWRLRPIMCFAVVGIAIAWSWATPRLIWSDLDIRTLKWTMGFESVVPLGDIAAILPLLLVFVAAFVVRRRGDHAYRAPWRAVSWTSPALVVPLVLFTTLVLIGDAAATRSWTLTRQNLSALVRSAGCGIADDADLPVLANMRPLPALGAPERPFAEGISEAPVPGLLGVTLRVSGGQRQTPWFEVPAGRAVGVFADSVPRQIDRLVVEWGRRTERGVVTELTTGLEILPGPDEVQNFARWRFLSSEELVQPTEVRVDAVRFRLLPGSTPRESVSVTAPVAYLTDRLAVRLREETGASLILPNTVMFVPCAEQPRMHDGIVEPPARVIGTNWSWPIGAGTGPFDGVSDLYRPIRLPVVDDNGPVGSLLAYEIDSRIPGAIETSPPRKRTFRS